MTVSKEPTALEPRPRRGRVLMAGLAIAVAVAVLAAVAWLKDGALWPAHPVSDGAKAADSAPPAGAAATDDTPPPQLQLRSPEVVKSLALETAAVESRDIKATINCNGRVAFDQNRYVELRARTDGIVRRIGVDVGAAVDAHAMLAVIDSPKLGDLKTAYINALSEEKQLQWDATRLESLSADQAVPGKTVRMAQTALAQQQAVTANARQQLVNLGFSSQQITTIAAEKETGTELPLEAPWSAVIVAREAVEGQFVDRNARLFALADLTTMWIYLDLYEADLGRVKLGQAIAFAPDGMGGRRFTGQIDWINPEVDERTRITQARAPVANTDHLLRANMYGRGQIAVEAEHVGLLVPIAAVQDYRGRPIVFVPTGDDTFDVRLVTIGVKQPDVWELTGGVAAGEMVVTTGSFLLRSELEKEKLGPAE